METQVNSKQRQMGELHDYVVKIVGIPKRFAVKDWSDYKASDKEAKQKAEDYVKLFDACEGLGLFFYGVPGSGKTLLATLVVKDIATATGGRRGKKNHSAKFINFDDLCQAFSDGFQDAEGRNQLVQELRKVKLLCIDNFPGTASTTIAVKALSGVLQHRGNSMLPTIITSTIAPKAISGTYSPQVASLMKELMASVCVKNNDYRDNFQ